MIVEYTQMQDIDYILDNLSDKNIEELEIHFGENWKNYAKSEMLANLDIHSITAKTDDNTPVIVTGVLNDDDTAGWLYFLHTDKITELPLFELIKKSKKQVKKWMHDYDTLNACILNTNVETIKWAELVGFKPVNIQGDFIVLKKYSSPNAKSVLIKHTHSYHYKDICKGSQCELQTSCFYQKPHSTYKNTIKKFFKTQCKEKVKCGKRGESEKWKVKSGISLSAGGGLMFNPLPACG